MIALDVPDAPSPTGQFPAAVWATMLEDDSDDTSVPDAPSPTGIYPGPVWADSAEIASTSAAATEVPLADLSLKEPDYSDDLGAMDDEPLDSTEAQSTAVLNFEAMYRIIREVAAMDSGDTPYTAISADREFITPGNGGFQRRHFGLGFGLVLFDQASGHLGSVLRLMRQRDPVLFADVFGPLSDTLVATTSAATVDARLQPVDGRPLWDPTWQERFRRAGAESVFQAAQNEQAIEGQFRPMLNVAFGLGLVSDRALAMVYDRVVTQGLGRGLAWVVRTAGPLRTEAQREHALNLLDFEDLATFQTVVGWLRPTGRFGPETHGALVGALRRQGLATLPTPGDLMARLVAGARGAARQRLGRIRDSATLTDVVFTLPPGE